MNTYNFDIDFTNGKIYGPSFLLVVNDHNSTTFNFTFDQKGRYVFKLLYPDDTIYVQDIVDSKIVLTKGVLNQEGTYKFEVCLYGDDNRLTTARIKEFPVRHELVETDEPVQADDRLPILDNLIEETNKVVKDAEEGKFDGATFIPNVSEDGDLSWANDQGKDNPATVNIKGPAGEPGAVKMQVVDTLPQVGRTDTIYLVKKEHPSEQNLYEEYVYTENSGWEHIGDTSVDLTDYYTKEETDEKLDGKQDDLPIYYFHTDSNLRQYTQSDDDKRKLAEIINDAYSKSRQCFDLYTTFWTGSTPQGNKMYKNALFTDPYHANTPLLSQPKYYTLSTMLYSENRPTASNSTVIGSSMLALVLSWSDNICTVTKITPFYNASTSVPNTTDVLTKKNTAAFTPTNDYNPSTKLYTDKTHYENMTGYDATKTQILKNINGTLTWVDEA